MVGSQYNTETEDTADEGDVVTDLLIDGDDESAAGRFIVHTHYTGMVVDQKRSQVKGNLRTVS